MMNCTYEMSKEESWRYILKQSYDAVWFLKEMKVERKNRELIDWYWFIGKDLLKMFRGFGEISFGSKMRSFSK